MPSLDDKYKYYIEKHKAITKIAKTKLEPYIWVFDWWESFLKSILELDSAALALDIIFSIVRASLEGLASVGGWTPLPFAFSFGGEIPTSPFFFFLSPCWDFNPLWMVLGGERLLGRRKRRRKSSKILFDIFWIVYLVCSPQVGVHRDSCPIKGLKVCFNAIVPADHRHLRSQPCLRLQYPTLVSCCLRGLSSFLGHL